MFWPEGGLPLGEPDTWEEDLKTDKAVRKTGGVPPAGKAKGGRKRKTKRKAKKAAPAKKKKGAAAGAGAVGRERGATGGAAARAARAGIGGMMRSGNVGAMFARAGGGVFQLRG